MGLDERLSEWKGLSVDSVRIYKLVGEKKYLSLQESILRITKIERLFYAPSTLNEDVKRTRQQVEKSIVDCFQGSVPEVRMRLVDTVIEMPDELVFERMYRAVCAPYWKDHQETWLKLQRQRRG